MSQFQLLSAFILTSCVTSFATANINGTHNFSTTGVYGEGRVPSRVVIANSATITGRINLSYIYYTQSDPGPVALVANNTPLVAENHPKCRARNLPSYAALMEYVLPGYDRTACKYSNLVHLCFLQGKINNIVIDDVLVSTVEGCDREQRLSHLGYRGLERSIEKMARGNFNGYSQSP